MGPRIKIGIYFLSFINNPTFKKLLISHIFQLTDAPGHMTTFLELLDLFNEDSLNFSGEKTLARLINCFVRFFSPLFEGTKSDNKKFADDDIKIFVGMVLSKSVVRNLFEYQSQYRNYRMFVF